MHTFEEVSEEVTRDRTLRSEFGLELVTASRPALITAPFLPSSYSVALFPLLCADGWLVSAQCETWPAPPHECCAKAASHHWQLTQSHSVRAFYAFVAMSSKHTTKQHNSAVMLDTGLSRSFAQI